MKYWANIFSTISVNGIKYFLSFDHGIVDESVICRNFRLQICETVLYIYKKFINYLVYKALYIQFVIISLNWIMITWITVEG